MKEEQKKALREASACLSGGLRLAVDSLPEAAAARCEELRLRAGRPAAVVYDGEEHPLDGTLVTAADLRETVARAARYSVHSYADSLRQGFLTLAGGHRVGICGTAKTENGAFDGVRSFSSLNIRLARPVFGFARPVYSAYQARGARNLVIISPPGRGKTTLLRDLIRCFASDGIRVAAADERGELAALKEGMPQFDLGGPVDVLELCPKEDAVMHLIKTMSPAVLALDEITSARDAAAVVYAANCGVRILATAHALDWTDFAGRAVYQPLLPLFDAAAVIENRDGVRVCRMCEREEEASC